MFELEYDKEADAAYIRLRDGTFARNERVSNSVVLDLDENGELLGIEILNVRNGGVEGDEEVDGGGEISVVSAYQCHQ